MDEQELDVDVIFSCDDFQLRVHWETDVSATDEARVQGASLWFFEKYGINPSDYADSITIEIRGE